MLRRRHHVAYVPKDAAANSTRADCAFFKFDKASVVKKMVVCPLGTIAKDASNTAQLLIETGTTSLWTWDTTTTTGDEDLLATAKVVTAAVGLVVAANGTLTMTVAKSGSGKAMPNLAVYIDYEET